MTAPEKAGLSRGASSRDWRLVAVCATVDPELFFPTAETGPVYDAQVIAAKRVCAGCPVRPECLTEALVRIPYGIAGGLTEDERRTLADHTWSALPAVERAAATRVGGQAA
jgi:hypothetical protein